MKFIYCIIILSFIPHISFCQIHKLLKEIGEGDDDGLPNYVALTSWKDKIYFLGKWTGPGYSIWSTDGTSENTLEITSAYTASNIASIDDFLLLDLYADTGYGLYRTDGTEPGIEIIKSFPKAYIKLITPFNENQILFFNEPYGTPHDTLWVSDGTASGTIALGEYEIITIWTTTTKYGNKMIFSENSGNGHKNPPVITDGTPEGTKLVWEYVNTPGVSTAVGTNSFIFFKTVVESDSGKVFDGNIVSDIDLPGDLYKAFTIGHLNIIFTKTAAVIYNALLDSAYQLPVEPLYNDGYVWAEPILYNNKVYFHGADKYLYETDGTLPGTRQIATSTTAGRDPYLFGFNNTIFYNAAEGNNLVLRAFDLSTNTDTIFATVHPGIVSSNVVSYITNIGERLLYKTYSNAQGREWHVYDPFLTSIRRDLKITPMNLFPNPAHNELFFRQDQVSSNGVLYLFNHFGQLVKKEIISDHIHELNIQPLLPSEYYIHINLKDGNSYFGSFIKQ